MEIQDILLDKLIQLKSFVHKNKDFIEKLEDFPPDLLIRDLQFACDNDKGYYKDNDDNYFYIKGIKFNDEELESISEEPDSILNIEFTIVTENSITNHLMPINVFIDSFIENKLCASSKKEFEKVITKVVTKAKKQAFNCVNPQKCLNALITFSNQINDIPQ